MNPETRYTNRFREFLKRIEPTGLIVKHSDRFNNGIADLTVGWATGHVPVVFVVEVKYLNCVVKKKRKIPLKASQLEYLLAWDRIGSSPVVLVGTKNGTAFYTMDTYDGTLYAEDLREDKTAWEILRKTSIAISEERLARKCHTAPSAVTKPQKDS